MWWFRDGVLGKWVGLGEVVRMGPSQWDQHASKKRPQRMFSPHPLPFTLTPGQVKTQQEGGHLQGRKKALTENRTCWHFDLGILVSGTVRNKCLLFKPASPWYFLLAAWAKIALTPAVQEIQLGWCHPQSRPARCSAECQDDRVLCGTNWKLYCPCHINTNGFLLSQLNGIKKEAFSSL